VRVSATASFRARDLSPGGIPRRECLAISFANDDAAGGGGAPSGHSALLRIAGTIQQLLRSGRNL